MNSDFYLLSTQFIKYTFQQILYIFSIPLKYYFFNIFLFIFYFSFIHIGTKKLALEFFNVINSFPNLQ